MKIRNRLTLQFTALVAIIMFVVLSAIYALSYRYSSNGFYERLKERAIVSAHLFLEEDEINHALFKTFQEKYFQKLNEEVIQIYNESDETEFVDKNHTVSISSAQLKKIREKKEITFSDGERQYAAIYYYDNQGDFVIIASAIDKFGQARLENLRIAMFACFFLSLLFIYFAGWVYAKKALSPIPEVVSQVKKISASNLHLRVDTGNGKDEIAELSLTFNNMLERLESAFEMQKNFVSNASHELRTPLTAIIGEIEVLLSKDRVNEEYKQSLESVLNEAQQLNELSNGLLSLAQANINNVNPAVDTIRIDELLWEVRENLLKHNPGFPEIILNFENLPEDGEKLAIIGNKHLLYTAFSNLFENALKFSKNQPVSCNFNGLKGISINIKDRGIGIAQPDLNNIFQAFYRANNARAYSGHGIGLSLAEKIFKMHGASISVASELDKGTTFHVFFPFEKV
ncbi:MAG: HAMP domain-containing protein [Bacteroidetes bacterium]|nr:HAMP domain-containing protein [Bacteroidota bacterium]